MNKFVDCFCSCHAWRVLWDSYVGEKCKQVGAQSHGSCLTLQDLDMIGHCTLTGFMNSRLREQSPYSILLPYHVQMWILTKQQRKFGGNDTYTTTPLCLLQDTTLEALLVGWSHSSVIKLKNLCTLKVLPNWQTSSTHDGYLHTVAVWLMWFFPLLSATIASKSGAAAGTWRLSLGPFHTRTKSRDHEVMRAQKKVSKGRPNTPPKSCSVVTDPQV